MKTGETVKAVTTNSSLKSNGRKYFGETKIRKEVKELSFEKVKE